MNADKKVAKGLLHVSDHVRLLPPGSHEAGRGGEEQRSRRSGSGMEVDTWLGV